MAAAASSGLHAEVRAHRREFLDRLAEWVRIPSIAGDRRTPPVTLKLLVDGEELGSPNLADLVDAHAANLGCDLIVYSDTSLLDPASPAVTTTVRGIDVLENGAATLATFWPRLADAMRDEDAGAGAPKA